MLHPRAGCLANSNIVFHHKLLGKSVIARAMKNIVPSHISRIRNSEYNIDIEGQEGIDSFLRRKLQCGEQSLEEMDTELVPTPFVQVRSTSSDLLLAYHTFILTLRSDTFGGNGRQSHRHR